MYTTGLANLACTCASLHRYRCSSEPERVAANNFLLNNTLENHRNKHNLRTITELLPVTRRLPQDADTYETHDACQFVGAALRRNNSLHEADCCVVKQFLTTTGGTAFCMLSDDGVESEVDLSSEAAHIDEDNLLVYARANKANDEIIDSMVFTGGKTRANCWVVMRFDASRWIGLVQRFILVRGEFEGAPVVVRLAVCKLWKVTAERFDGDLMVARRNAYWKDRSTDVYPVLVSNIDCKVSVALTGDEASGHIYAMRPYVVSRRM